MDHPINTTSPLWKWLYWWVELAGEKPHAVKPSVKGSSRTKDHSKLTATLEPFLSRPSDKTLHQLVKGMRRANISSPLFEDYASLLWLLHRGQNLGIWKNGRQAPPVYYAVHADDSPAPRQGYWKLIEPARADAPEIPFRQGLEDTILHFLKKEQVLIVFSQVKQDLHQVVLPSLFAHLQSHNTTHQYRRILPNGLISKELITDDKKRDAVRASTFPAEGWLILDFLDFNDWDNVSARQWLPPLEPLVESLGAKLLTKADSRLIVLIRGNAFSYQRAWKTFLPFYEGLSLKQSNVVGIGVHPQFMNRWQAAQFLRLHIHDVRLIASRLPLLVPLLYQTKTLFRSGRFPSSDEQVFEAVRQLADVNARAPALVAHEEQFVPASDGEIKFMPQAFRPPTGHSMFTVSVEDGEISPPVIPHGSGGAGLPFSSAPCAFIQSGTQFFSPLPLMPLPLAPLPSIPLAII